MPELTDADRDIDARASKLAALNGPEAVRGHTGVGEADLAYVLAFGEAQYLLAEQAAIIRRLTGS